MAAIIHARETKFRNYSKEMITDFNGELEEEHKMIERRHNLYLYSIGWRTLRYS